MIAITGIPFGLSAQTKGLTDLDVLRLKGPVRSVMETKYLTQTADTATVADSVIFKKYTEFDPNGFEQYSAIYETGKLAQTSVYTFGPDGKQAMMEEFNADNSLHCRIAFTYNEKGFRTQADYDWVEQRGYDDNLIKNDYVFVIFEYYPYNRIVYEHEYRGYVTQEEFVQSGGQVIYTYKHRYDARGNKISMIYFNASGHTSWVTKYKYDRYDNLIESNVYKNNYIALETEYNYRFDDTGNWTVRHEKRNVHRNILTVSILEGNILTEREISYY